MQDLAHAHERLTAEEKLRLLVEFGTRISSELHLDKLLDIIAQQITQMLDVGRCTIYLKDEATNELWSKIAQGKGLEHTEIRIPLNSDGFISLAARTGQTINLPNAYEDSRFSIDVDIVTAFRTHATIAVPLKNNSGEVLGVFQASNKSDGTPFDKSDEGLLRLLATLASGSIEIAKLYQEVRVAQLETIYRLAVTAEYRDQQDTRQHLKNISIISYLLALALGMNKSEAELIKNASPLHDIGKVALADNILLKPGKLTPDEFETMKSHTIYGGRILEGAHSKVLQMAHKMSLYHHEKWNGLGYPKGLRECTKKHGAPKKRWRTFWKNRANRLTRALWRRSKKYIRRSSGCMHISRSINRFKKRPLPSPMKLSSTKNSADVPADYFRWL